MATCVHFSRSLPSNSWWQTMAGWQVLSRPSAAEGGGRRLAFTGLATQPYSTTEVDGWQHKLSRVSQNRAAVQPAIPSDIECSADCYRVGFRFNTEISRCALDLHMSQECSNRLQIAGAFQNVECLRPTQGFDAIGPGIESCLDHPELQQTAQLPPAQWTTARRVTARE
jgi:hypothetical protein